MRESRSPPLAAAERPAGDPEARIQRSQSTGATPASDPLQTLLVRRPASAVEQVADTRSGQQIGILSPEFPNPPGDARFPLTPADVRLDFLSLGREINEQAIP